MNTAPTRTTVPWTSSDATTAFVMTMLGAGAVSVAWWGASGTGRLDRQVMWTVVAVLGLIVIGVASFTWLLSGRRAVALRRENLLDDVDRFVSPFGVRTSTSVDGMRFLTIAGSQRYHREGCQLVRGKDAARLPGDGSALDGLRPCEMCEPATDTSAPVPDAS